MLRIMKIKEANAIVGGFGEPGKMPCYTWSIPARLCQVGSKMRRIARSTCSKCYALKGRYVFPVVQDALQRRYEQLQRALLEPGFDLEFIAAFVRRLTGEKFFRWFDSGDLQGSDHLRLIVDVALSTPETKHWLPTREQDLIRKFQGSHYVPSNLIVRVSAQMIDGPPPVGFKYTSTVHSSEENIQGFPCRANRRGGVCGPCRACWDFSIENVSYPEH